LKSTALQHRKILNGNVSFSNVTPVLILHRYMLFGLVPASSEISDLYEISDLILFFSYFSSQSKGKVWRLLF